MDNPVLVLLEEPSPILRSRAHLALGQRALDGGNLEVANDHLREAADLDPTDEVSRGLLDRIADGRATTRATDRTRARRSWWPF